VCVFPHHVFMCFVSFSNSINKLVFLVESVFFKVGIKYLSIISMKFRLQVRHLVTGLSPQRPGFDPRSLDVKFVVDEVALEQFFLPVLRFSPVYVYRFANALYSSSSARCTCQKEKLTKPGHLSRKQYCFGNGGSIGYKSTLNFF
jgi:hypothetical protein